MLILHLNSSQMRQVRKSKVFPSTQLRTFLSTTAPRKGSGCATKVACMTSQNLFQNIQVENKSCRLQVHRWSPFGNSLLSTKASRYSTTWHICNFCNLVIYFTTLVKLACFATTTDQLNKIWKIKCMYHLMSDFTTRLL